MQFVLLPGCVHCNGREAWAQMSHSTSVMRRTVKGDGQRQMAYNLYNYMKRLAEADFCILLPNVTEQPKQPDSPKQN